MFSAIIFDIDDTLVYYENLNIEEWYEEVCLPSCESLGIEISLDDWNSLVSGKFSRDWPAKLGVNAKTFWKTIDEYNYKFRIKMGRQGRIKKYEDTDILSKIDVKMIAYSVSSKKCAEFSLEITSLRKFFYSVYGKDLDNYKFLMELKPHGGLLREILRRENISPSDCLVIGDSPRDYFAGIAAGCSAIIVDRENKYQGDFKKIENLWELISLL